jgi:beta-phosphoglucomutase-like phosphatase (HAD superfamily)
MTLVSENLKGLILDMDGVLLDSSVMLLGWYSEIFEQAGYSLPIEPEDVMNCFHMAKREALKTLAGLDDSTPDGHAELERIIAIANETRRDTFYLKPRDGAEDFLFKAREKVSLSAATNADSETHEEFFNMMPPDTVKLFNIILDAQSGKKLKPAPDMLYAAMDSMCTQPSETAFAGDSKTDILAGDAAEVTTILIRRPRQEKDTDTIGWEAQPAVKVYDLEHMYVAISALANRKRSRPSARTN